MHHLVIGASEKPFRYSFKAINRLKENGYSVKALGLKQGEVAGVKFDVGTPQYTDIHTITLYINPEIQVDFYDYLIGLNPKRIIFNPGTGNPEFIKKANDKGIETVEACTLVMLSIGNY